MSRRLVLVPLAGLLLALLAGAVWTPGAGVGARPADEWTLKVADAEGRSLWVASVVQSDEVVLEYTNSIYNAPTWEHFEVAGGALSLTKVSTTREAVLEYHRLAPPYRWEHGRLTREVSGPTLLSLRLRVGETGRPTLHVGSQTLPLYTAGVGAVLTVTLERMASPSR